MPETPAHTSLHRHQAAFSLLAEGVVWIDQAGKIRGGNTVAAQLLGYDLARLAELSYFEINPHFSLMGWKKFWAQLPDPGRERLETEFVNAAGKLFSVRGWVSFDDFQDANRLCLVVFSSTEAGRREADLLEAVQRDGEVGGWEYNLSTGQVYLAANVRRWLGWSPERDFYPAAEFLAKITPQVSAAHLREAQSTYQRSLASAKPFEQALTLADAQGESKNYWLRGNSVENELEVYKLYGTLRPEQQHRANPIPVGEAGVWTASLDHSLDAVYWVDLPTESIVFANARACEQTGFSRRELQSQNLAALVEEAALPALKSALRALPTQPYQELRLSTLRKDGGTSPIQANLHLHRSEDGKELAIVVAHDVSRNQEDAEFRALQSATLDMLQEWVVWLDKDGQIVWLNTAARRKLSRLTSRELTGLSLQELLPDLEVPSLGQVRQDRLEARLQAATDYVYTDPGGTERTLQVHFEPVAAETRLFLCVLCRDVTQEHNNKRRLTQAKKRVDELRAQLESENEVLKAEIETVHAAGPILTVSKKYQRILGQIGQVAGTDATVLITGETGTGKELLAQSIHNFSSRGSRRMVSVNCAALPENLIESELFGHERGAFTGAFAQKKGKFELANGGTLFLDEIGEMPLDMQAKLLRALQEGEIQRIGSNEVISVDVRVVAATNRNLERMIKEGRFREDLYYRLNVFPIHNLPLRERREDIPVLVNHFTRQYAEKMGRTITQINQRDLNELVAYDFPGNVRELINLVERAVITANGSTLNLGASLRALRRTDRSEEGIGFSGTDALVPFEEMQRRYIIEALRRCKGKITGPGGAAELLDVNGRTLMSKMNKLGISRNDFGR
ncbi:sigma 54-interacting transcriptional regulator [Neolewinella lacunae]|uniref:Sigma 54-interacting transcriptional regulator n=1 Tax=Neolewinella lacunae TaxID=1517758 RepID=A0A923PMK8_9BACT|nr:sigma 54-interacting transcriptional regulator [Neolewinella lacunae]MBC6995481.1 sigma 54-interacting transcriptional regulator [Neolewinella lacunae]MDN3635069.1 sigma 54-interacting transcriptional regulator [Neolewinella lacunae]